MRVVRGKDAEDGEPFGVVGEFWGGGREGRGGGKGGDVEDLEKFTVGKTFV